MNIGEIMAEKNLSDSFVNWLDRQELPEWPPIKPLSEEEELEPTTTAEELEEESKAELARKIEKIMGGLPPK
jgi:hypothetical protein